MNRSHRRISPRHLGRLFRSGPLVPAAAAAVLLVGPAAGTADASQVRWEQTHAVSVATPVRTHDTDVAFEIRQFGWTAGVSADNRAVATARYCTAEQHCRSVALSFQIVTTGGSQVKVDADNSSKATTTHCTGCEAVAGAYQFVINTPQPVRLGQDALRRLSAVEKTVRWAARNQDPAQLKATVDGKVAEITEILQNAVAAQPAAPPDSLPRGLAARPGVTVHRMLDGWPGSD
ncbi:hypothetical protein [Kitasatospora sp. NPDC085879]|uniref:hypothetical protein n=1 Tax=Kitasatospora sp. NPDC085879 TaxID=3154769 RepID=UPI000BB132AA|nr:hypothetical protein [Streptomyces sp. TLI_235]PBC76982.1 hypothetical protein BX265_1703 [Streptomyces sp. TLI_235]